MHRPVHLPAPEVAEHIHVVLVEPGVSLNVGSVARAMDNLGFRHLHLVAPRGYDPQAAAASAAWATGVLDAARLHDTLDDALAGMHRVVGFTARHGADRPEHLLLADWCARLRTEAPARTALVFGPEDHGLRREHLRHCRWLVRIPSVAANPAYNLAQSVLLALYELSRTDWEALPREAPPRPTMGEFAQLDRLVAEVLTGVGYFGKGTPRPIPHLVQHLFRRIDPDTREMRILLGLFGKIDRTLKRLRRRTADDPAEDDPPAEAGGRP